MTAETIKVKPLVSIIIDNYNYDKYVEKAIESALHQTWVNVEIIVVDDGSKDNSRALLQKYEHRVHVIYKANGGQASAMNAGYRACRGDIVCFLDSDDEFLPEKVERIVTSLKNRTAAPAIVVHAMQIIDGVGEKGAIIPGLLKLESGDLRKNVFKRGGRWTHMPTSALTITRPLADMVFPIPEQEFRISADCFIFTLAPLVGYVCSINEPLSNYRIHGRNAVGLDIVTAADVRNYLLYLERSAQTVNDRLRVLGIADQINLKSNLSYTEQKYFLALLTSNNFRQHLTTCTAMVKNAWRDDLYPNSIKLVTLVTSLGMFLPRSLRKSFISFLVKPSPTKTKIVHFVRMITR